MAILNPDVSGQHLSNYYSLVHEVGHWLGLFHTFEDGCSSGKENQWGNQFYYMNSDGVTDTPAQARPTNKEAGKDVYWKTTPALNTCPDAPVVDTGNDPVENIMNYSNGYWRQASSKLFTQGQIERMVAEYETYRHVEPIAAPTMTLTRTPTAYSPTRLRTNRPTGRPTPFPTARPLPSPTARPTSAPTVVTKAAGAQCLAKQERCNAGKSACCDGLVCIGRRKRGRCNTCHRQNNKACFRTTDCCGHLTCKSSGSGKVLHVKK